MAELNRQHRTYSLADVADEIREELERVSGLSAVMRAILHSVKTRPTASTDGIKGIAIAGKDMLRIRMRRGRGGFGLGRSQWLCAVGRCVVAVRRSTLVPQGDLTRRRQKKTVVPRSKFQKS